MIKDWLIKHWWVNEMGKFLIAIFFGVAAYGVYVGTNVREAGFVAGVLSMMSLFFLVDITSVLYKVVRGKEPYKQTSRK